MTRYNHPLEDDDRDRDETYLMEGVDVTARMSSDGKRVEATVIDQDGEETEYRLGGLSINATPIRAGEELTMYDVTAEIEWQGGGLGLYPALNVKLLPPKPASSEVV